MELAEILPEKAVIACSGIKSKRELLEVLAARAAELTGQDGDAIFEALNQREQLGSTGLGNGIAVPHGKFAGLGDVVAVFARLDHAVDFDALDDEPVDIAVMLLAPMGAGADHLKALAKVARVLRTESLVEDLRRTSDPAELHAILSRPLASTQAA
ncbi:transcriptional regulator [Arsenicitalea aurantiaca]|uniref:Transcriptional regulator n=1 Tax=Arsenicitalea aurantiaca TaxID=1783274 RepID=A0A433X8G6_9HYPH|nr:PTS sugar transporter subunit IIA [Arsenicitalea aurantiaca]RUT30343.1 transcriptional regulator [Arsenicitalea aurantiaca]